MDKRMEEDPDEEPEEPGQPQAPDGARAGSGLVPAVGMPSREWEFSTRVLSLAQVVDGVTLVRVIQEAATDGWDMASVIDGGDKRVILMRRPKRAARESRRVGFAPPTQS